jgi:hypothetical protein
VQVTEPVQLAIVAGLFTTAGAVVAGFFAIWKLAIETRSSAVAANNAANAAHVAIATTKATNLSLQDAAVKLDKVHELLTADPAQASLQSEIALLRATVAVALSSSKQGD